MSIFAKAPDENEISSVFSDILAQTQVVLFKDFKIGYKNGLKTTGDFFKFANSMKIWALKKERLVLEQPQTLGFITGLCVNLLVNTETYDSIPLSNLLSDMIYFLKTIPGFDLKVLQKRIKRLDVKNLSSTLSVNNLKIILAELSR
jgi:hypothetical protein